MTGFHARTPTPTAAATTKVPYRVLAFVERSALRGEVERSLAASHRWRFDWYVANDPDSMLREAGGHDYDVILVEDRPNRDHVGLLVPRLQQVAPTAAIVTITDHVDLVRAARATEHDVVDHIVLDPATAPMLPHRLYHAVHTKRRIDRLHSDQSELQALLADLPVGFLVLDRSGTIDYANDEAARLLASTPKRLRGSAYLGPLGGTETQGYQTHPPGAPSRHLEVRSLALESDAGTGYVVRLVDPAKTPAAQTDTRQPQVGATNPTATDDVIAFHRHLATALAEAPVTLAVLGPDLRIEACYGGALTSEGISTSALGERLDDILSSSDPLVKDASAALAGTPRQAIRERHDRAVYVRVDPALEHGQPVACSLLFVALPESVAAADLPAHSARSHAEHAEAMDRFRSLIINRVAHEFNTPLTPLTIAVDALQSQRKGPLTTDQERLVASMERNVERLRIAVRRLVDIDRISSGTLQLERRPTPLDETAERVLARRRTEADQRRVTVELKAEPVTAHADPDRIDEALDHLVRNAIQACDPGGHVRVEIKQSGDHAMMAVHDDGRGFTEAQRRRMFEPMAELEEHEDAIPGGMGLGLGIYLTRAIAAEHGSKLVARSPGPGQGATFQMFIPLREAAQNERTDEP